MKLLIMRHGEAEPEAPRDSLRQLTQRGEEDVVSTLKRVAVELSEVRSIYYSPYIRAEQTARLAGQTLGIKELQMLDLLTPGGNPRQVVAMLESMQEELASSQLLLVSHQPLVGTLVDSLCGFEPGCYRMGTSAIASLSMDVCAYDMAHLNWLKQPGD